jgi:hypothetical protein
MYNQSAASYCMYNSTNASQVVCIIDNKNQTHANIQYPYLPEYSMDISIFSYMYTLFLAFGCYSILSPISARKFTLKTIVNLAKYTIVGYGFFKEHIYKPYIKHVHPRLLNFLCIDDGINEILVVKNGQIVHTFKTMELFVKNNPIKFVKEFSDDEDDEEHQDHDQDHEQSQEQDHEQSQEHPSVEDKEKQESHVVENVHTESLDLSDKVDYNKKCDQINELIEAFKTHSLEDKQPQEPEESHLSVESDETDENQNTGDEIPDEYILDPTAYDFIIRNFYYEDEKTGETHSYVFKYDIFYKSEMVEKYDVAMIKDKYFSTRKFIGLSLKMNNQKYNINLTSPNNYYISDNSILNYSFLKWYMNKNYNVKLSHNYVISGIDNYVEMYKIHAGKKIIVHKNRFEVVDDESFVESEDQDNNNIGVNNNTENDSDGESSSSTESQHETENDSNKEINMNLEETHELCDIEILDYD